MDIDPLLFAMRRAVAITAFNGDGYRLAPMGFGAMATAIPRIMSLPRMGGMDAVWMWYGCGTGAMDVVWIWHGFGMDVVWKRYGYSVWILYGFGMDLVWIWYGFGMDSVWMWYGCGMDTVWEVRT